MKTKADFQNAIAAAISNYPTAAQFYRAKDPRLLAQLDAMATMLAMLSQEMETAAMEPFTKARDTTVLADAAIKGILPFARPVRIKVTIDNTRAEALNVPAGRRLLDAQGRIYVVDQGAVIAGLGSGFVTAVQKTEAAFEHTVSASQPFYAIDIPQPEGGKFIAEVRLSIGGVPFVFAEDFVNVAIDDKTFHLETDEYRTLKIVFGAAEIAGYQPDVGEVATVTVVETEGAFELASESPFSFEYSYSLYDSGATLKFDSVLTVGASPLDIATLREITNYPSVYDSSAVYLGNFDFLIRRQLSPLRFLSVWNEQTEESVRGANIDNINRLFVSAQADGIVQGTLETSIANIIKAADDSYRITFVTPVATQIVVVIDAEVSAIYDFAVVEQQIREVVAAEYGPDSLFAKHGSNRVLYKRLYDIMTTQVEALQGNGSDLSLTITDPGGSILPEQYRYIADASLTVNITQATF
jgi:hypothetical protein